MSTQCIIALSAACYAASFYMPYCWWLSFLWPILFMYAAIQPTVTYADCIIWSFFAMGLHCTPLLHALAQLPTFLPHYLAIASILLIGYATVICISALLPTLYALQKTNPSCVARAIIWTGSLTILFLILTTYGFLPFGLQSGYSLFDPLIPLIHIPVFLSLLSSNQTTALLIFFATAAAIATLIRTQKITLYLLAFYLFLSITVYFLHSSSREHKEIPPTIQPMPYCFSKTADPVYIINTIQELMLDKIESNPTANLFVFPESAIGCSLSDYVTIQEWSQDCIKKPIHLIIGGVRTQNENSYNCIYWFYNGTLQLIFDKRFPVPLVESELPRCPRQVSLRKNNPICSGTNPRPQINIDTAAFVPYICSDLFFNTIPDDEYPKMPILALCNDNYSSEPLRYLMHIATHYKSIRWERPILYIDYHYCYYYCQK